MLDKLASVEAQYNYLMGLIADPAVQADPQAYRTHTKTLSDLQELVEGGWSAAGDLEIFELNRQLGLQLPEADGHHTLAGFLLERLQHIPSPGEGLRWKGFLFNVLTMDGPRIDTVRVSPRAAVDHGES